MQEYAPGRPKLLKDSYVKEHVKGLSFTDDEGDEVAVDLQISKGAIEALAGVTQQFLELAVVKAVENGDERLKAEIFETITQEEVVETLFPEEEGDEGEEDE